MKAVALIQARLVHSGVMDKAKIPAEFGWQPTKSFECGLRITIRWYLDHPEWIENVRTSSDRDWIT